MSDKRIIIEKILCCSDGQDFQRVFSDIMVMQNENFTRVTSYGPFGDRKNDGYLKGYGVFFQVYGPEEHISSQKNAIKKMKNDFRELINNCNNLGYWEKVEKCVFVYNDMKKGITSPLLEAAKNIEKELKVEIEIWGIDRILTKFDSLNSSDQEDIIKNNYHILKEQKLFYTSATDKLRMDIFFKYFKNFIDYLEEKEIMFGHGIPLHILYTRYYREKILLEHLLRRWENFDYSFFSDKNLEKIYKDFKNNFFRLMEILRNYYYYTDDSIYLTCHYFVEGEEIFSEIKQLEENINLNSHDIYMNRVKEVRYIYLSLRENINELIEAKQKLEFYL